MTEDIELTVRKLFNKLSPDTFEQVYQDFTNIQLDGKDHLVKLVVDIITKKVAKNSTMTRIGLFAKLVSRDEKSFKLKTEILARCQTEFQLGVENADRIKVSEANLKLFRDVDHLRSELDSFKSKSIKCSVANIQLIGQLYNYDVAGTGAIMECVDALLNRNDDVSVTILCALMKTIGPKLYAVVELCKKDEEKPTKLNLPKLKENRKFVTWVQKIFANFQIRSYSGNLSLSAEAEVKEILKLQEKQWKTEEIIVTSPIITAPIIAVETYVNPTITNAADFVSILKQRKIDPEVVQFLNQLNANNAPQISQQLSSQSMEWYNERIISIIYKMLQMCVDSLRQKSNWKSCANLVQILCSKPYRASKIFRRNLTTLCQAEIRHHKLYAIWLKGEEDQQFSKNGSSQQVKLQSEELEDAISLGRKRFRGNVQFIGELFNVGILTFQFIKETVDELMDSRDDGNLEGLCTLLKTTGEKMYKQAGKSTATMFNSLAILANSGEISVAMKTMIIGVVDLSEKRWTSNCISKSSSLWSVSSNSTSGALKQNDVPQEIGNLVVGMSSVSVSKPHHILEKEEIEFEAIRAQPEKSVDTVSSSSGDMVPGGTISNGNPGTSKSVHSIENNCEIGACLEPLEPPSCPPPQLKYLSMYTNYDRMFRQLPPEVVEDINMEISTIIYQRLQHQRELASFPARQNDLKMTCLHENDMT